MTNELRPVKNYREAVDKLILETKNNFPKRINESQENFSVPVHIKVEWELINIIINYTNVMYDVDFMESGLPIKFTSTGAKQYYTMYKNYLLNKKIDTIKTTKFNKKFGKNGIYNIMAYNKGVVYYKYEDMWEIYPAFLEYLQQEYSKNEELYGLGFYKKTF